MCLSVGTRFRDLVPKECFLFVPDSGEKGEVRDLVGQRVR